MPSAGLIFIDNLVPRGPAEAIHCEEACDTRIRRSIEAPGFSAIDGAQESGLGGLSLARAEHSSSQG